MQLDPRVRGDFVIKSETSGWLGRSNYAVHARVTHRPSGQVRTAQNESPWESRRQVEKRAMAELKEALRASVS